MCKEYSLVEYDYEDPEAYLMISGNTFEQFIQALNNEVCNYKSKTLGEITSNTHTVWQQIVRPKKKYYKIEVCAATFTNSAALVNEIKECLNDGWQAMGNFTASTNPNNNSIHYSQLFTKKFYKPN